MLSHGDERSERVRLFGEIREALGPLYLRHETGVSQWNIRRLFDPEDVNTWQSRIIRWNGRSKVICTMTSKYIWTDELLLAKELQEHVNGTSSQTNGCPCGIQFYFWRCEAGLKLIYELGGKRKSLEGWWFIWRKDVYTYYYLTLLRSNHRARTNVNAVLAHKPTQQSREIILATYYSHAPSNWFSKRIERTREVEVVPL